MVYLIAVFKGKKKLGLLKNSKGKVMTFKTREEAQTTANIESTQMEAEGLNYVVKRG